MPVKLQRYTRAWNDVNRKVKAAGTTGLVVMLVNIAINQFAPGLPVDGETIVQTGVAVFELLSPIFGAIAGYIVAEDRQK